MRYMIAVFLIVFVSCQSSPAQQNIEAHTTAASTIDSALFI